MLLPKQRQKKTYMAKLQPGSKVCLWILVHNSVESLLLVLVQCGIDIVETRRLDIVEMVGKNDSIQHRIHCTSTSTWKELEMKKYKKIFTVKTKIKTTGLHIISTGAHFLTLWAATKWEEGKSINISLVKMDKRRASKFRRTIDKQKNVRTIAEQHGSSVVPCLKHLILKEDLRDTFQRSGIKQIAHSAIRSHEVPDFIHHLLVMLWNPVCTAVLLVCNLGDP